MVDYPVKDYTMDTRKVIQVFDKTKSDEINKDDMKSAILKIKSMKPKALKDDPKLESAFNGLDQIEAYLNSQ